MNSIMKYLFLFSLLVTISTSVGGGDPYYGYPYYGYTSTEAPIECDVAGQCNPQLWGADSKCFADGLECLMTTYYPGGMGKFDPCGGECIDPQAPMPTCVDSCTINQDGSDDCDASNFEMCGFNELEGIPMYGGQCMECVDDCLFTPYNCLSVDDCDMFKTQLQHNYGADIEVSCIFDTTSNDPALRQCGHCQEVWIMDTQPPQTYPPYDTQPPYTDPPYSTQAPCGCDLLGADACAAEGEGFICAVGKEGVLDYNACPSCQHHCAQYLGGCSTDDDCAFDTEYQSFTEPMTCHRYHVDDECGYCVETCSAGTCNPYIDSTDQCDAGFVCVEQPQSTYQPNSYPGGGLGYYSECNLGVCETQPEPCTDLCEPCTEFEPCSDTALKCADTEICAINYNTYKTGGYYYGMQQCYECFDECTYNYGCRVDADCEYETGYYGYEDFITECVFDSDASDCGYCNYISVPWNTGVTDEPEETDTVVVETNAPVEVTDDVSVVTDEPNDPEVTDDDGNVVTDDAPEETEVNETNAPNETEETVDPTECTDDIGTGFCWGKGTCKLTKRTLASDLLQFCKVCAEMDTNSCLCETVAETLLAIAKDQSLSFLGLSAGIQQKILDNCWEPGDCSGIAAVTIVNADTCDCSALMCDKTLGGDVSDKFLPGSSGNRIGIWMAALVTFIFYVLS